MCVCVCVCVCYNYYHRYYYCKHFLRKRLHKMCEKSFF